VSKRIAIFVDGSNFNEAFKFARFRPNYQLIENYFAQDGDVVGMFYFTALPPKEVHSPIRAIMDHIEYHGWTVVSKETKTYGNTIKGNMDCEIVVQAWLMWEHFTDLVLFSGDGDFTCMVRELQNRGRRVTAVSIHERDNTFSMVADELRRQVNKFIDLRDIADYIRMDGEVKEIKPKPALTFLRGR
jgi:uncharacterized LabA/DUF88 family protein